jgi:prepilin peptidase CpaA
MTDIPLAVAWLVTIVLIEAAIIDGRQLRVPNWLTFHFAAAGLVYAAWSGGREGLIWSLEGAGVGLLTLLPLYAIGGMGAGDVKLMAGLGTWMGPAVTLGAFVATAITGGVISLCMIVMSGDVARHWATFQMLGQEILVIRDPSTLAARAAERKPTMMLLPYAVPIAIGSISYFSWLGLLS